MKIKLILTLLLLTAINMQAQQPIMKVYLADGSSKQYNLADIDSLSFSNKTEKSQIQIFYSQTKTAYYPPYLIDKIRVDTSDSLSVYISGYPKNYYLALIDSIIFYPTQYPAITIGEQVWMTKNLNVDHYQNGDSIPEVRDSATWRNLTNGAWCYYNNSDSLGKIYGKLYNWYSVIDKRGLAPSGWHIPTDEEWKLLEISLGMKRESADSSGIRGTNEGAKLKEQGFLYWLHSNEKTTNESGFSALPSGSRGFGDFLGLFASSNFWTTSDYSIIAYGRGLAFYQSQTLRAYFSKCYGLSLRCVKDN